MVRIGPTLFVCILFLTGVFFPTTIRDRCDMVSFVTMSRVAKKGSNALIQIESNTWFHFFHLVKIRFLSWISLLAIKQLHQALLAMKCQTQCKYQRQHHRKYFMVDFYFLQYRYFCICISKGKYEAKPSWARVSFKLKSV